MNKKYRAHYLINMIMILTLLISIMPTSIAGASPNCTSIASVADLDLIRTDMTGNYCLTADLDLASVENFIPLGLNSNYEFDSSFTGTLDGQGHSISNVSALRPTDPYVDYFGFISISSGATIKNIQFQNLIVRGGQYSGGLAGSLISSTIDGVEVNGNIVSSNADVNTYTGGFAGTMSSTTITRSNFIGEVTGRSYIGGIAGLTGESNVVSDSYVSAGLHDIATLNYTSFSGSGYIQIPDSETYHTSSFTLEAWFFWDAAQQPDPNDNVEFVVNKGYENFEVHTAGGSGINGLRFIPVDKDLTAAQNESAYLDARSVLDKKWVHVAVSWDLATTSARIYIDGVPQPIYQNGVNVGTTASIPLASGVTDPLAGNIHPFIIGARSNAAPTESNVILDYPFNGRIADVRFWNKVRTSDEIKKDFQSILTGNESGLIGNWKLDESSGQTVYDSSTNENNGSLVNAVSRVTGTANRRALFGSGGSPITVTNVYYNTTIANQSEVETYGTGLTELELKTKTGLANFTFSDTEWKIVEAYTFPTRFAHTAKLELLDDQNSNTFNVNDTGAFKYKVTGDYIGTPGQVYGSTTLEEATSDVSSGVLNVTLAHAGDLTLSAKTVADDVFTTEATDSANITVSKVGTTTSITSTSPSPSVTGEKYTVNVKVTATDESTPDGTVTVSDGTLSCDVTISDGTGSCDLTPTTAGAKSLSAKYAGTTKFVVSETTGSHTVNKADTEIVVETNPNPSAPSQEFAVNVTAKDVSPGSGSRIGAFSAYIGETLICSGTLTSNAGSCNSSSTTIGDQTVRVVYAGDTNFNGDEGTVVHNVSFFSTKTELTLPSTATVVGEEYSVSATVSPTVTTTDVPTGTVIISDGAAECTITLASGTGSCDLTSTTPGTKTITATYSGATKFDVSSKEGSHTVNKSDTTIVVTTDPTTTKVDGETTVKYDLSVDTPGSGTLTGSVIIKEGTTTLCTDVDLTGSCAGISFGSVDEHTITASYSGDTNFNSSQDEVVHTVEAVESQIALTLPVNGTVVGEAYNVSIQASSVGGDVRVPSGTVTISDGAEECDITLSVGTGSCDLTSLTAGDKKITATYDGDIVFSGSSDDSSHTVSKADTTLAITTSPSSTTVDNETTIDVKITVDTPGTGTPTGTIIVKDGSTELCSETIADGAVSCSASFDTISERTLTATYDGDTNFNGNSDDTLHTIAPVESQVVMTLPELNTVTGESYIVSVEVNPADDDTRVPSGSVTVSDGAEECEITLTDGVGDCDLTSVTAGGKTITALYDGDRVFGGSEDSGIHTVDKADTTLVITTDPDTTTVDQETTINVTISVDEPGAGEPTGTIIVKDGETQLCEETNANGEISCAASFDTKGKHTLTASYAGDDDFNSGEDSVVQTVAGVTLSDNITSTLHNPVGDFDMDGGTSPITYSLETSGYVCTTTNGADNDSFRINGSTLERLDATTAGDYAVCVMSVDDDGAILQTAFSITINNPPSLDADSLDKAMVNENISEVGTLAAAEGLEPYAYSFVAGSGTCSEEDSTDNGKFEIEADTGLITRVSGTTADTYKVCAGVTDDEGDSAEYPYTIVVSASPSDLSLDNDQVYNDLTEVGIFGIKNGSGPFTYTLETEGTVCASENSEDNDHFSIDGDGLSVELGLEPGKYSVCVQATDTLNISTQQNFVIEMLPRIEKISLSALTTTTSNSIVAAISSIGGIKPISYSLYEKDLCSEFPTDNADFSVDVSALKLAPNTTAGSKLICIRALDTNGEDLLKTFEITVEQGEPVPTDWSFKLTSDRVIRDDPAGTVVGTLLSTVSKTTYELVEPETFPASSYFTIDAEGHLTLSAPIDENTPDSLPIRIKASNPAKSALYLDAIIEVYGNGFANGMLMVPDKASSSDGVTIEVDVSGNDTLSEGASEWSIMQIAKYPANGQARIGSIIYTPNGGFTGSDYLTYRVCDNNGNCGLGSLSITSSRSDISAKKINTAPVTGFAPDVISAQKPNQLSTTMQSTADSRIKIPQLGVDAAIVGVPIFEDKWDVTWLGSDVGWLNGSAYPSQVGNALLTAHNSTPFGKAGIFSNIKDLKYGDRFTIQMNGFTSTYEVRDNLLVLPNAMNEIFKHQETYSWITLMTCENYDLDKDTYVDRRIVRAVMISQE